MDPTLQLVFDILLISFYIIIAGILSWYTLHYYAKREPLGWGVYVVLLITYWMSYAALFLISVDLSIVGF